MKRTYDDVVNYVENQSNGKCKVISAKPEHSFDDLGIIVKVWNVKTDVDGDWWVVEGERVPMNLYPQGAYYFSAEEVYSFHMGLMERMYASHENYEPEGFVRAITMDGEIAPSLFRKLKNVAMLIDGAQEVEDFQAIGVQCREILIELGNTIYYPEMSRGEEQPQASNFKRKAELFVRHYMSGSENSDYRSYIKKVTEATWDYASKITHSQTATFYEASSCVTMTTSLVGIYENIRQKIYDVLSQYICKSCKSKKLLIIDDESNDEGVVTKLYLQCKECGEITAVVFDIENRKPSDYIQGKIEDV